MIGTLLSVGITELDKSSHTHEANLSLLPFRRSIAIGSTTKAQKYRQIDVRLIADLFPVRQTIRALLNDRHQREKVNKYLLNDKTDVPRCQATNGRSVTSSHNTAFQSHQDFKPRPGSDIEPMMVYGTFFSSSLLVMSSDGLFDGASLGAVSSNISCTTRNLEQRAFHDQTSNSVAYRISSPMSITRS